MKAEKAVIEEGYIETPVPREKEYGKFNGTLQLLSKEEVIDKYAMPFEKMTEGCRRGIGLFKLPQKWLPKEGEKHGMALWRKGGDNFRAYYYYEL